MRRNGQPSALDLPAAAADGGAVAADLPAGLPTKARIQKALQGRFFLRVHMFVILGCTIGAGMLSTRVLHALHFTNMAWRYGIAVASAYAVFLALIRLWLMYVGYCVKRTDGDLDWLSGFNFSGNGFCPSFPSSDSDSSSAVMKAGGGQFGGGGASGSGGEPMPAMNASSAAQSTAAVQSSSAESVSAGSSGSGGGSGFSLDVDDDLGLILLVAAVALAIVIAGFWLIWAAPAILGEAAFQAALAAALARRAKKMAHDSSWVGSVVKATVLPFLAVLVAAVVLGWYAHGHCPSATRLADAFNCSQSAR